MAAKKYITQEKQESRLQKALDAANKLIAELKAQIASLTEELVKYKSIHLVLNPANLKRENEQLRSKLRWYESVIDRQGLWHLFGKERTRTQARSEIR